MQEEQKIQLSLIDSVLNYAKITKQAGLDGVVCSVHEAGKLERLVEKTFYV